MDGDDALIGEQLELNFEDGVNQAEEEAHFFLTISNFAELVRKYGVEKVLTDTLDEDVWGMLDDYYSDMK